MKNKSLVPFLCFVTFGLLSTSPLVLVKAIRDAESSSEQQVGTQPWEDMIETAVSSATRWLQQATSTTSSFPGPSIGLYRQNSPICPKKLTLPIPVFDCGETTANCDYGRNDFKLCGPKVYSAPVFTCTCQRGKQFGCRLYKPPKCSKNKKKSRSAAHRHKKANKKCPSELKSARKGFQCPRTGKRLKCTYGKQVRRTCHGLEREYPITCCRCTQGELRCKPCTIRMPPCVNQQQQQQQEQQQGVTARALPSPQQQQQVSRAPPKPRQKTTTTTTKLTCPPEEEIKSFKCPASIATRKKPFKCTYGRQAVTICGRTGEFPIQCCRCFEGGKAMRCKPCPIRMPPCPSGPNRRLSHTLAA